MNVNETSVAARSLDAIGRTLGIDQSSLKHDYLDTYEELIASLPLGSKIVLLCAKDGHKLGEALALRFQCAKIEVYQYSRYFDPEAVPNLENLEVTPVSSFRDVLRSPHSLRMPDLLIEDGNNLRKEKIRLFTEFFPWVSSSGVYVVEDLHASTIESLSQGGGEDIFGLLFKLADKRRRVRNIYNESGEIDALSQGIESISFRDKLAIVRRSGEYGRLLGEDDSASWFGPEGIQVPWVNQTVVEGEHNYSYSGRATTNIPSMKRRFQNEVHLPSRIVREYDDVLVYPKQVVSKDRLVLPESFRLFRISNLSNTALPLRSGKFAKLPETDAEIPQLKGVYYYLDSEHLDSYGHTPTEVLSRVWYWKEALQRFPNLKALLHVRPGAAPPQWVGTFLEAAGICQDRLVFVDSAVRVDRLIGVTPLFSNFSFAHPHLLHTWQNVTENFLKLSSEGTAPERIFVTRSASAVRPCRNQDEVEDLFRSLGFEVILPEREPLPVQASLFNRAKIIAGFGGSAMINTIFSTRNTARLVITHSEYSAINEYLIAALQGASIHYQYQDAEIKHDRKFKFEAYKSPFQVDIDSLEKAIKVMLKKVQE